MQVMLIMSHFYKEQDGYNGHICMFHRKKEEAEIQRKIQEEHQRHLEEMEKEKRY